VRVSEGREAAPKRRDGRTKALMHWRGETRNGVWGGNEKEKFITLGGESGLKGRRHGGSSTNASGRGTEEKKKFYSQQRKKSLPKKITGAIG